MMADKTHVVHTLKPLIDPSSRVLILGSFPSVVSREKMFYYANPSNRFWPVLARIYDEEITDREEFCHRHHIALYDVIYSCWIHASSDSSIEVEKVNDIEGLIRKTDIQTVFTTGSTASRLYERYIQCHCEHIALPSTSSANARMRLDDLVRAYQVIREKTDEEEN
jgi:hypoxanthine-DNA glycosylase